MVHPRVLKEAALQIFNALKYLFELSINNRDLPDEWKSSIVSVIHKQGSKSSVSNYKPISLTSVICKSLESIIRYHIMNHFSVNKLYLTLNSLAL